MSRKKDSKVKPKVTRVIHPSQETPRLKGPRRIAIRYLEQHPHQSDPSDALGEAFR